jgi:septum formation protein
MRLILASASPRRAELLRTAGYSFDTVPVDVDERVRPGEAAEAYVRRLAIEKSAHAYGVMSGFSRTSTGPPEGGHSVTLEGGHSVILEEGGHYVILAADTAVVVDGDILGKPVDNGDARRMLRRLSGREHEVMTGISLRAGDLELGAVETTRVEFVRLSSDDVEWYVRSGEGRDKAGAYAIQGLASRFIPRIDGSYTNVVGLPVARVAGLLDELGCRPSTPSRA